MKPSSRHFLIATGLLLCASLLLAATKPGKSAGSKGVNFERTKQRIDALFKRRLKPEPLPVNLPNPFQVVGGTINAKGADGPDDDAPPKVTADPRPVDPAPKVVEETGPLSDSDALAGYAARLKIGGTIQLNGRAQLIINQSPYKEGDFIFVDNKDAVIYLQIVRITPTELTLRFKDIEQTLRLKN
jgi:hypothetical protein